MVTESFRNPYAGIRPNDSEKNSLTCGHDGFQAMQLVVFIAHVIDVRA